MRRDMQRPQASRIDLGELKSQIVKKIGIDKSRKYFYFLSRFLSQKLSKSEFDKSCYRLLGRENLPLHNQLILSILKNASKAMTPPLAHEAGCTPKSLVQTVKSSPGREDGPEKSGFPNQIQNVPIWSNGVLPASPRRVRSGIRDRKMRDRLKQLEPNGKVKNLLDQSMGKEDNGARVSMENGNLGHCNHQRSGQFDDVREMECSFLLPMEKPKVPGKDHVESAFIKNVQEEEEQARLNLSRSPLVAPLGVPFFPAGVVGACKTAPVSVGGVYISCYDSAILFDSETLRKRMESIVATQGLGGVSIECANMLNNMLDVYLKRLVKSCVDLVGARSANGPPRKQTLDKRQILSRVMNGIRSGNNLHTKNINGSLDATQDQRPVSLLDFRVAMELNPQLLGESWPMLLGRICMRSLEE